ncbi:hypothetical protein ACFX2H_019271 [Malus domestica]
MCWVYLLNHKSEVFKKFKAMVELQSGYRMLKLISGSGGEYTLGCIYYGYILGQLRQKLDESSMKGIFVGYGKMEKGYKIYNLKIRVILSRSVLFDEKSVWNWNVETAEKITFLVNLNLPEKDKMCIAPKMNQMSQREDVQLEGNESQTQVVSDTQTDGGD